MQEFTAIFRSASENVISHTVLADDRKAAELTVSAMLQKPTFTNWELIGIGRKEI